MATIALAGKPICGDGNAKGGEACDGADLAGESCTTLGYDSGALSCLSDCTFDIASCATTSTTTCGDSVTEGYEECDGADDSACVGACSDHCACPATSTGDLEIHVIDVGQGDSILVVSPDGFTLLMDAGTESQDATVSAYLASIGIASLDYTLVSHMDADHAGGMDGVLQTYPEVVACFDHGGSIGTTQYSEYDSEAGSRRTPLQAGDTIDMGSSIVVDVLHSHQGTSLENNNSNVIRITHGERTFLIGGDCETSCESSYDPGIIDVYKVHHHGSDSSSGQAFLEAMSPWTATISVGAGNAYGHPHTGTLDRLASVGATVYRTDQDGDIEVLSDGVGYTVNGDPVCDAVDTRVCGTTDVGACSYGTIECTLDGVWGSCAGAVDPVTEDCANGIDDDCDGADDTSDTDCTSSSEQVLLTQVAYDTPGADSIEEFVDLYNPTTVAVDVSGWTLTDGSGSAWALPSGTVIDADSALSIARDSVGFLAWQGLDADVEGLTLSLNNGGDRLVLKDSTGVEVDRVAWENFDAGWSISASTGDSVMRADPATDTDTVGDWTTGVAAAQGGATPTGPVCGDGTCGSGEDCTSCAADCDGVTGGKAANRYCCGNGTCESVGEDTNTCPVDC